ncbi:hypothetical protein IWW39_003472 [Coemansia spiralis]|uniref:F-box domain-containing protein n=1 Tax=Coemansia spiralis TaxID=417178 RepID=A0A9W8GIH8_9FUNG|nr:hypothetical protein IWW39_003472 [Coemansia spiralis]
MPLPLVASLPAELFVLIFERLLDARSICECSQVCRSWYALTSHDSVWNSLLTQCCVDTRTESGLLSEPHPRLKLVYAHWHQRYRGFLDSYTRIRRSVLCLESWAETNCPPLFLSLAPGLGWMGSESIPVRELLSVVTDSPHMRDFLIAYHLHDGQRRQRRFLDYGLFGSYECYGEVCSLSWLSSRMLQVIAMGQFKLLVFAWCHITRNYLGIVVGCPPAHSTQIMHHVVQLQPQSYRFVDRGLFGDFFTGYIRDLVNGRYDIQDDVISMLPNSGPHTGTSVSRGIRTTASIMFCPDETPAFRVYRYQISFEILDFAALGCASVQLKSRHWLMYYQGERQAQSSGHGVVGEFPILSEASPYYRYCSRMTDDEMDDLMLVAFEGYFTMVPGTLVDPAGPDFTLAVPYTVVPIPMEIL